MPLRFVRTPNENSGFILRTEKDNDPVAPQSPLRLALPPATSPQCRRHPLGARCHRGWLPLGNRRNLPAAMLAEADAAGAALKEIAK